MGKTPTHAERDKDANHRGGLERLNTVATRLRDELGQLKIAGPHWKKG
jgi:hypothetical protein